MLTSTFLASTYLQESDYCLHVQEKANSRESTHVVDQLPGGARVQLGLALDHKCTAVCDGGSVQFQRRLLRPRSPHLISGQDWEMQAHISCTHHRFKHRSLNSSHLKRSAYAIVRSTKCQAASAACERHYSYLFGPAKSDGLRVGRLFERLDSAHAGGIFHPARHASLPAHQAGQLPGQPIVREGNMKIIKIAKQAPAQC